MAFDISSFLLTGTVFSKDSNTLIIGFGKRRWISKPESLSFYFPDFFLTQQKKWFVQENTMEITLDAFLSSIQSVFSIADSFERVWHSTPQKNFEDTVSYLHRRFQKGELVKAVPYICHCTEQSLTTSQLVRSLAAIAKYASRYPAYVYGFWDNQSGILGATPELLFKRSSDTQLETMACAGTRSSGSEQLEISRDPKELYEHQLVINDISNSLAPFGEAVIKDLVVRDFGKLVHLVTPITLRIEGRVSFEQLVAALHPTSALGAIPREEGKKWLLEHDSLATPRGRYGAPAGYSHSENELCVVAIRNMQWVKNRIDLFAGCGVVPESIAENEWKEIHLKLHSIKELLAL